MTCLLTIQKKNLSRHLFTLLLKTSAVCLQFCKLNMGHMPKISGPLLSKQQLVNQLVNQQQQPLNKNFNLNFNRPSLGFGGFGDYSGFGGHNGFGGHSGFDGGHSGHGGHAGYGHVGNINHVGHSGYGLLGYCQEDQVSIGKVTRCGYFCEHMAIFFGCF